MWGQVLQVVIILTFKRLALYRLTLLVDGYEYALDPLGPGKHISQVARFQVKGEGPFFANLYRRWQIPTQILAGRFLFVDIQGLALPDFDGFDFAFVGQVSHEVMDFIQLDHAEH